MGRALAGIGRVRAGRGAVHRAFHDALQDGGDAEHIVGEVEVPVVDALAPGAPAVGGDVILLRGYPQRREIEPADAAELPRRNAPAHAVIGNVRQRMPQGGELPVEDGENSRLARMENQIVEAVIAVHDGGFVACGNVVRQPGDEIVHGLDFFRFGGLVLLAPAPDLAREIIAGLAEIGQADGLVIHLVQHRDDAVHFVVDRGALGLGHAGQGLIPQHAPLDAVHDVEGAPDHALVLAQGVGLGYRDIGLAQRGDHAELALDRMRRGQQFRRGPGLGAHRIALAAGAQPISRVGLAALELLDFEAACEPLDMRAQIRVQPGDVEALLLRHRHGADELIHHPCLYSISVARNPSTA